MINMYQIKSVVKSEKKLLLLLLNYLLFGGYVKLELLLQIHFTK